jgi:hypothetical protein
LVFYVEKNSKFVAFVWAKRFLFWVLFLFGGLCLIVATVCWEWVATTIATTTSFHEFDLGWLFQMCSLHCRVRRDG